VLGSSPSQKMTSPIQELQSLDDVGLTLLQHLLMVIPADSEQIACLLETDGAIARRCRIPSYPTIIMVQSLSLECKYPLKPSCICHASYYPEELNALDGHVNAICC
jgi:hypothetical protein